MPVPARPDEDAARIDVHAAGVGFVDTLVTRGKYHVRQDPPFDPGMEMAGKQLRYFEASRMINCNQYATGGGAHSDIFRRETGRFLMGEILRE